jgi:hypothetical protein
MVCWRFLADVVADALRFGAVDEVLAQPALDARGRNPRRRSLRAVVVDQVLQHVAREFVHAGVEGQAFVDDFAGENFFEESQILRRISSTIGSNKAASARQIR